ncbi:MAG: metal ABC transporter permease [Proteobacteria bacterium]|nr:metal ABC transporter permease [Pseudomonadota bacterium]
MHHIGLFDMMLPAFVECVLLSGILCYLGLHVIRREIIFVDLALAQIAAMGATIGIIMGMAPHSIATWVFSLLFTAIGAAIFSVSRVEDERVPQEAVIGLIYAISAATVVLLVAKAPHGAEHIKEMLVGAIIWVKWPTIAMSAVVFPLVGVLHVVFGSKFLAISQAPGEAFASKMHVRLWDFLFYLTFGFVITVAVRTAGVLLVFVLLVVPAIAAMLLARRFAHQLAIGWIGSAVAGLVGLVSSYYADLPAGPSVAVVFALCLILLGVVLYIIRADRPREAMSNVGLVSTGVGVVLVGLFFFGRFLGNSPLAASRSEVEQMRIRQAQIENVQREGPAEEEGGR